MTDESDWTRSSGSGSRVTDRILLLAPAPFDFDRGKSIRIRQSVEHLSELGYSIDVLAYPSGRAPDYPQVRVDRAPQFLATHPAAPGVTWQSIMSNAALVIKATWALRAREYTAIHAHDVDGALIAMVAKSLARSDVPWVYDMHGAFSELAEHYELPIPQWIIRHIEQRAYDSASHVILNWPHLREIVTTATPTTLIMDQPATGVQEALAEDIPLDAPWGNAPYILYTGNYAPYQGVELLLEAFERLLSDGQFAPTPQLVLTGEPDDDAVVDHEAIHYVGFVSEQRLATLHQHASVLVSPRLTDGFPPMKILYYLLTDNPIVVTNKSCHTSVLGGHDGVVFADPTPATFADALVEGLSIDRRIDRTPPFSDYREQYRKIYASVIGG